MKITNIEDIIKEEGIRNRPYQDVVGLWTVGIGHLIGNGSEADYKKSPYYNRTLTDAEVMDLLQLDISPRELWLSNTLKGTLTSQNQFNAIFSLLFNIGQGNLEKSSVLRYHKAGKYPDAAAAFMLYNKARENGQLKVVNALTRRRAREAQLYLKEA